MEKRRELIDKIRSLRVCEDAVKKLWIRYVPKPVKGVTIGGVDGSSNFKEFKSFSVIALSAEAVVLGEEIMDKVRLCDVDVLYPYFRTRERVRVYMLIMEILATLKACEKVDLLLLDGSIINNLVRHIPRNLGLAEEILADSSLNSLLENEEFNIRNLINYVISRGKNSENYIICIEFLKYLSLLRKLLERSKEKIIAIAKTSQSTLYFKEPKPDIAIFEKLTRTTGFSKPIIRGLHDILASMRSKASSFLVNFFNDVDISIFYFRVVENGPVLKAEVPRRITLEDIKEILNVILTYSVMGYPYPLKKAHADSDIKEQDMECILRILSAYDERTGREQHEITVRHWY